MLDELVAQVARRMGMSAVSVRLDSGALPAEARRCVYWLAVQRGVSQNELAEYFRLDRSCVRRGIERMESLMAVLVSEAGL